MAEESLNPNTEQQTAEESNHSAGNKVLTDIHSDTEQSEGGHGGSHGEMSADEVFPTLLGNNLGDHREFSWLGIHICELPVIIYDSEEGLHLYSSSSEMIKDSIFTMTIHGAEHGYKFAEESDLNPGHAMHWKPPIVKTSTIQPAKDSGELDAQAVTLDLSVTSLMLFQWTAMLIILVVFGIVGRKFKKNPTKAPHGIQNAIEAMVVFVRDDIVRPNCGSEKAAKGLLPYFIGLFFFIFVMNILGLVPGGHTATGALAVTGALAIVAYFVINITAIREAGIGSWLKHLLGGAPIWLSPIMIPIEIISMFVKPFALTIRLFANMTAGHVVLLSLVGLIFFFKISVGMGVGLAIAPISIGFSVFMYMLEFLVALLQAYIFTILTAVFVGLAIGDHAHEEAHEH
ncbi:F0F1 ATP synthase subunit A [Bacteroidota bacterium]